MDKNKLLAKLKEISKSEMSKDLLFHDHVHVEAVYDNVKKLLKHENGNDLVLLTAALFHDVRREKENHGLEGAKYVRKLLKKITQFPQDLIEEVAHVIEFHDKKDSQECNKIFSDADTLDAFSSLGLARSFMVYAKQGFSLKEASLDYDRFLDKLYKRLKTKTAKILALKEYRKCKAFAKEILKKYDK
jgi:uncharacterized protein